MHMIIDLFFSVKKTAIIVPCALYQAYGDHSLPALAKPIPKCSVVVVLPTPPFWLATAMTLHFDCINKNSGSLS